MRRCLSLLLPLFVVTATATAASAPATRLEYNVLFQGQSGGSEVVTTTADGRVHVEEHYRDNGRGPDLSEDYRLAPDGSFSRYRVRGTSTFGSPVKAEFTRDARRARWTATGETGQTRLDAPAVYLPIESSFQAYAQVAVAALANGGSIAMLPGGTLRVQRLVSRAVNGSAGARSIGLYALIGISTEPQLLWLTEGAEPRLFAAIEPWLGLIEKGYEAEAPALGQAAEAAKVAYQQDLATRLRHPLPGLTVVRNVRIFDSATAQVGAASDITVFRGRITTIRPAGSAPQDVQTTIDGGGRIVLPGLFDMHAHLGLGDGALNIASGVTTVRDLGNQNEVLDTLRDRIAGHDAIGPRVVANGFIEGDSPNAARNGIVVNDIESAQRAVDWYAERDVRQLKLYNSFKPEWVPSMVTYAHARGLKVGGHIPAFMRAEDAVRAGYDEVHHLNQLLLNFLVKPGDDTRTLLRFTLIRDQLPELDLDSPAVRDFIALLAARGTVVDPTLTVHEAFVHVGGEVDPSFAAISDHLPLTFQRALRSGLFDVTRKTLPRDRIVFGKISRFMKQLFDAGVTLVPGTDSFPGFALHRELELYVAAGIPAPRVLQMATRDAARVAGLSAEAGRIALGYAADLTLVDGDPTATIADIRRVAAVVQGDSLWQPQELFTALGIEPFAASVGWQAAPVAAPLRPTSP
jgi:imidazolonepropionase-like amidohydrolase